MKRILFLLLSFLCCAPRGVAGTITGQIQTPSTGRGVPNGAFTFTLSQAAVVSGTATLAANGNCWTDSNGNVVGLPGDAAVAAPVLSSNLGSGSLAAGTYFVRYTWANATGESQASSERSLALTSSGTLVVQAPTNVPPAATSMKIYVGAASGGETLQGSVTVTNGAIAGNYSQSVGLVAGAALPSGSTSLCQIRFNDELQPSYTGYSVALTNVNGASVAGFPQKWYLSGGSNGIVNVGVGLPLYSGVVIYPQPIVSNPAANGVQSINGPLNMNGFSILNTVITNPSGAIVLLENTAPSGVANNDVLYADSTAHRFKMINNNGAVDVVVGANTAETLTNKTMNLPDGSASAPSYSFANQTGTGFFHPGGGSTGVAVTGVQRFNFGFNLQQDGSVGSYCFVNGNPFSGTCDVGISRDSAGVMDVGSGLTVGDTSGAIQARRFNALGSPSAGFFANGNAGSVLTDTVTLNSFHSLASGFSNKADGAYVASGFLFPTTSAATASDTGLTRTGAKTVALGNGTQGDASGTLMVASLNNGGQLALPTSTDTLVGRATTDTLTNKTFDTVGTGNIFKINGTQISSVTGSGSVAVLATSPQLTTPNIGVSSGNTHTFVTQTAPSNPPAGSITIYGDSGSGNLACRNSSGTSCLSASAAAPLISTSANPAGTGVVRVASGDTAVAFRNAANTGDITGLTKDGSDVVQVGGSAGMKINGGSALTTSNQSGTGSLCMTTNCSMTTPNIGSATATAVTTTAANPATSGVLRCAGNQACAVARTPDNTNDVQLGYALNGPLAVFGSVSGSTSGVTAEVGELKVDTGVTVQSTGFKHFRLASGTSCTTPGAQGSGCTTGSISLPGPAFPDSNYTLVCIMEGPATGSPVIQDIGSKTPSSFTLGVTQVGNIASSYGAADCIAIHD
ncbi:MAG TPA: hypothetical protein VI636_21510 [Candidatus Angelobacter sp.]